MNITIGGAAIPVWAAATFPSRGGSADTHAGLYFVSIKVMFSVRALLLKVAPLLTPSWVIVQRQGKLPELVLVIFTEQ